MSDHEHVANRNTSETSEYRLEICDCGARRRTPRDTNGEFGDPEEWGVPSWVKRLNRVDNSLENLGKSKSWRAFSFFGALFGGAVAWIWWLIGPVLLVLLVLFLSLGGCG